MAAHLLDPMRARVLALAREPRSASQIAESLGMPRQRVNYHVKLLRTAGLLIEAGRREKRNLTEVLYRASAATYLVDPAALGALAPSVAKVPDKASADYLLAFAARLQADVTRAAPRADEESRRIHGVALDAEVRLASGTERDAFARELQAAVSSVVSRHDSARGKPWRVVVAAHPDGA